MPYRNMVTKELSELLGVLSHPHRLRIVEELRKGEMDVNSLAEILGISHPGVSQHLSIMRTHKVLVQRRQGRNVFYHLRDANLAIWLTEGLNFIDSETASIKQLQLAVKKARKAWAQND